MTETKTTAIHGRASLIFIFIVVVLDMLAFGMIIPVLPGLIGKFTGNDTARTAVLYGLFGTSWAAMQFFFSPVLGMLSDRFGRRPVILISCFGLGLDFLLMALAPSLGWLLAGRIISGITAASFSTAGAYIADITPEDKRAGAFGLIGVAFGIGFVLGPALGGLLGAVSPQLPFWVAAALSLTNATYGMFVLPESLPKERRMPFSFKRANPIGALILLRSQRQLAGLATAGFLMDLAHVVLPSTAVLYMGYRYGWSATAVGFVLAGVGACAVIVQGTLVRPAVARLGERGALISGLTLGTMGFVIYGLAPTGIIYCIGIPIMALWGLAEPAAQGMMTRRVSGSEQGQLQGAISSLTSIANLVGPGLFTAVFAASIHPGPWHFPGTPFLLAALLLSLSALVAWHTTRR